MHFDCKSLTPRENYKLLISTVVPRPIAFVTTRGADGKVNAAPFSFFNAMDFDPPIIVLGLEARPDGQLKDTATNIQASGEFVVNIVDNALAERMNICAIDFEPDVSEPLQADLELLESVGVSPPRIAASPVSMECEKLVALELRNARHIVLGEARHFHIRDDIVIDREKLYLDLGRLDAIGRLNASGYTTTRDRFDMPRIAVDQWDVAALARRDST